MWPDDEQGDELEEARRRLASRRKRAEAASIAEDTTTDELASARARIAARKKADAALPRLPGVTVEPPAAPPRLPGVTVAAQPLPSRRLQALDSVEGLPDTTPSPFAPTDDTAVRNARKLEPQRSDRIAPEPQRAPIAVTAPAETDPNARRAARRELAAMTGGGPLQQSIAELTRPEALVGADEAAGLAASADESKRYDERKIRRAKAQLDAMAQKADEAGDGRTAAHARRLSGNIDLFLTSASKTSGFAGAAATAARTAVWQTKDVENVYRGASDLPEALATLGITDDDGRPLSFMPPTGAKELAGTFAGSGAAMMAADLALGAGAGLGARAADAAGAARTAAALRRVGQAMRPFEVPEVATPGLGAQVRNVRRAKLGLSPIEEPALTERLVARSARGATAGQLVMGSQAAAVASAQGQNPLEAAARSVGEGAVIGATLDPALGLLSDVLKGARATVSSAWQAHLRSAADQAAAALGDRPPTQPAVVASTVAPSVALVHAPTSNEAEALRNAGADVSARLEAAGRQRPLGPADRLAEAVEAGRQQEPPLIAPGRGYRQRETPNPLGTERGRAALDAEERTLGGPELPTAGDIATARAKRMEIGGLPDASRFAAAGATVAAGTDTDDEGKPRLSATAAALAAGLLLPGTGESVAALRSRLADMVEKLPKRWETPQPVSQWVDFLRGRSEFSKTELSPAVRAALQRLVEENPKAKLTKAELRAVLEEHGIGLTTYRLTEGGRDLPAMTAVELHQQAGESSGGSNTTVRYRRVRSRLMNDYGLSADELDEPWLGLGEDFAEQQAEDQMTAILYHEGVAHRVSQLFEEKQNEHASSREAARQQVHNEAGYITQWLVDHGGMDREEAANLVKEAHDDLAAAEIDRDMFAGNQNDRLTDQPPPHGWVVIPHGGKFHVRYIPHEQLPLDENRTPSHGPRLFLSQYAKDEEGEARQHRIHEYRADGHVYEVSPETYDALLRADHAGQPGLFDHRSDAPLGRRVYPEEWEPGLLRQRRLLLPSQVDLDTEREYYSLATPWWLEPLPRHVEAHAERRQKWHNIVPPEPGLAPTESYPISGGRYHFSLRSNTMPRAEFVTQAEAHGYIEGITGRQTYGHAAGAGRQSVGRSDPTSAHPFAHYWNDRGELAPEYRIVDRAETRGVWTSRSTLPSEEGQEWYPNNRSGEHRYAMLDDRDGLIDTSDNPMDLVRSRYADAGKVQSIPSSYFDDVDSALHDLHEIENDAPDEDLFFDQHRESAAWDFLDLISRHEELRPSGAPAEPGSLRGTFAPLLSGGTQKYASFQRTPGGRRYRELLVQLVRGHNPDSDPYGGGHWSLPDIMGHARVDDRIWYPVEATNEKIERLYAQRHALSSRQEELTELIENGTTPEQLRQLQHGDTSGVSEAVRAWTDEYRQIQEQLVKVVDAEGKERALAQAVQTGAKRVTSAFEIQTDPGARSRETKGGLQPEERAFTQPGTPFPFTEHKEGVAAAVAASILDAVDADSEMFAWPQGAQRAKRASLGAKAAVAIYDEQVTGAVERLLRHVGMSDTKWFPVTMSGDGWRAIELTEELKQAIRTKGLPFLPAVFMAHNEDGTTEVRDTGPADVAAAYGAIGALIAGGALAAAVGDFGALAKRIPSAAGMVAIGALMRQSDDPDIRKYGLGALVLGGLHAMGTAPAALAGQQLQLATRRLAETSPLAQRALGFVSPRLVLSPDILQAIDAAKVTKGTGAAAGRALAKRAAALGPEGDRLVSDLVEGERWQSTAGMSPELVKAAHEIAADYLALSRQVTAAQVREGLLDPAVVDRIPGYLKRRYASHLAPDPLSTARATGRGGSGWRIEGPKRRALDLPVYEAQDAVAAAQQRLASAAQVGDQTLQATYRQELANAQTQLATAQRVRDDIRIKLGEVREFSWRAPASLESGFGRLAGHQLMATLAATDAVHPDWARWATQLAQAREDFAAALDTPQRELLREELTKIDARVETYTKRLAQERARQTTEPLTDRQLGNRAKLQDQLAAELLVAQQERQTMSNLLRTSGDETARLQAKASEGQAVTELAKLQAALTKQGETVWAQLPDSPAYGVLRNGIVRRAVADELAGVADFKGFADVLRWWKTSKTVWNPGTHAGNIGSNIIVGHMNGLPLWEQPLWLTRAQRELNANSRLAQELQAHGVIGQSPVFGALPDRTTPTTGDLTRLMRTTRPETAAALRAEGVPEAGALGRVGEMAGAAADRARAVYLREDDAFRTALYLRTVHKGATPEAARAAVTAAYGDFDKASSSRLVRLMRSTATPFITYQVAAVAPFARAVIQHPWRWMSLTLPLLYLNELGQQESGHDLSSVDVSERERDGIFGVWIPNLVQVPIPRDRRGGVPAMDVSRFTPLSGVFTGAPPGTTAGALDLPSLMAPTGPLVEAVNVLASNKASPFSDEEMFSRYDTRGEVAGKLTDFAEDLTLPTALGFNRRRLQQDLAEGDTQGAVLDVAAYGGVRPRYYQPFSALLRERTDKSKADLEEKQELRSRLRDTRNPALRDDLMREFWQRQLFRNRQLIERSHPIP